LDVTIPGLYFVEFTLKDPSGNAAAKMNRLIEVVEFTGVNELNSQQHHLEVFPNPNNGKFTIVPTSNVRLTEIKVLDVLGRTVNKQSYTNNLMDISILERGVYYILAEDENGLSHTTKMILE
jgi:hypothetical protein